MEKNVGFPFVHPPVSFPASHCVARKPGTRRWVEKGQRPQFRHWLRELHRDLPGDLVPLQWVPQLVGVSRKAVQYRVRDGGLTVFAFVFVEPEKTILGTWKDKEQRGSFEYASTIETEAWRDLLLQRTGTISDEERQESWAELRKRVDAQRDGRPAKTKVPRTKR